MAAFLSIIGLIFAPTVDRLASPVYAERKEATETLISFCLFAGPHIDYRLKTESNPEIIMRLEMVNSYRERHKNNIVFAQLFFCNDKSLDEAELRHWSKPEVWPVVVCYYETKYNVLFSDNVFPNVYCNGQEPYCVLKQIRELISLNIVMEKVK